MACCVHAALLGRPRLVGVLIVVPQHHELAPRLPPKRRCVHFRLRHQLLRRGRAVRLGSGLMRALARVMLGCSTDSGILSCHGLIRRRARGCRSSRGSMPAVRSARASRSPRAAAPDTPSLGRVDPALGSMLDQCEPDFAELCQLNSAKSGQDQLTCWPEYDQILSDFDQIRHAPRIGRSDVGQSLSSTRPKLGCCLHGSRPDSTTFSILGRPVGGGTKVTPER